MFIIILLLKSRRSQPRYFILTNSTEQSPWEANSHQGSQKFPHLLRNPKVHYRIHKIPPLLRILRCTHPVNNFPKFSCKMNSNIISPSTPSSSKLSLTFRFSYKNVVHISQLSHACYMPRLSLPPWLSHHNNILWSVQVMKLLLQPPATSSVLCQNILLSTLFSNTLNLLSSLSVRDQVSDPYKTT